MKTALILHGMPSKEEYFDESADAPSNAHWLPWIQRRLLLKGILAQSIELPQPYEPNYERYSEVFEQNHIDAETILIGHSCGAGFIARWLSEHPVRVGKVILVAPWLDPEHELSTGMFDFTIDAGVPERTAGMTIFNSDDDSNDIHKSVEMLTNVWPSAKLIELSGKGHFVLDAMKTREFPELEREALL